MGDESSKATREALLDALSDEQLRRLDERLGERVDGGRALEELRRRFRQRGIALVLGAGVSVDAGVPTWAPLLDALLLDAITESVGVEEDQARLLANVYGRMISENPPIQARYLSNMLGRATFLKRLRATVYADAPQARISPLLSAIASLCHADGSAGVREVLTYNFDVLLEEALTAAGRAHTVVERDAFPESSALQIRHVHGWLGREPSHGEWIVLAEDEFHQRFADPFDWGNVVQLNAFSRHCCLFVGLSMEDPDLRRLLDAVSGRSRAPAPSPQHFALLRRTGEEPLRRSLAALGPDGGDVDAGVPDTVVRRLRWMRDLADLSKSEVLAQLGVTAIWFEDFATLPGLLTSLL